MKKSLLKSAVLGLALMATTSAYAEGNACFDNEEYHTKYGWIDQNWKTDVEGEYILPNFMNCGFDLVVTFAEDGTYEYSAPDTFSRVYGSNWCLLDNGYGSYAIFYPNGVGAEEYDYLLFQAPLTGHTSVAEDADGKYLSLGASWKYGSSEVIVLKVYLDNEHNLNPTGIDNVAAAKATDHAVYNLNGMKAEKANGFVISNGKIMFVK